MFAFQNTLYYLIQFSILINLLPVFVLSNEFFESVSSLLIIFFMLSDKKSLSEGPGSIFGIATHYEFGLEF